MKSLAQQIDDKLATAHQARLRERAPSSDPRDAAEAGERAAAAEREADELRKEREDDLTLARSLRNTRDAFGALPLRTPIRDTVSMLMLQAALLLEEEAGPQCKPPTAP